MEHAGDLGALGEPACDAQGRLLVTREPHPHGAQAAQAEVHVVRPDAEAGKAGEILERLGGRGIGRDGAEHQIRMAAEILGARND